MRSKAQVVREYIEANPEAALNEIVKRCKVTKQYVYQVRSDLKKRLAKKPKAKIELAPTPEPISVFRITMEEPKVDTVNHPPHYKTGGIETIDFIEAKELGYHLGNVIKYVSRAKHKGAELEDLKKAQWYLERAIMKLHI
jgi:hypothetical protein